MILIVARHLVRPEHAEQFPTLVESFAAATRAEPGTISFEWARSVDEPNVYLLVEAFRDAAAGDAHVHTEHFKAAIAMMPGLLAEPPQIVHADIEATGWTRMGELTTDASPMS